MQIDQTAIQNAIVEQAVREIMNDDDLYSRVKTGVEARIDAMFAGKVRDLIDEKIAEIVKEGFDRAYTKRDSFGRPVGEPTSISKEMEGLIQNYWTERVDRQGKKTDSSYSSTSRAEWMMVQICADDFTKEMKGHVVNVAGALKDHFRSVLNDHTAKLLSDVFHVNSHGDQALRAAKKDTGRACIDPEAKKL